MTKSDDVILIVAGTPQSKSMYQRVVAAIQRCERLNQLAHHEHGATRAAWSLHRMHAVLCRTGASGAGPLVGFAVTAMEWILAWCCR